MKFNLRSIMTEDITCVATAEKNNELLSRHLIRSLICRGRLYNFCLLPAKLLFVLFKKIALKCSLHGAQFAQCGTFWTNYMEVNVTICKTGTNLSLLDYFNVKRAF